MIRALALRSRGGPGLKTRSDHLWNLFLVVPGSTSQLHLYNVNTQLVCSCQLKLIIIFVCVVLQAMLVSFLPVIGPALGLCHMCLLYSLYTFEYKWVNMGECNVHG